MPARSFLAGGGEMGERIRALDWSCTPLGPVSAWPQSLLSPLSMMLPSKAQICFFWGPDFVVLYNDSYRPVFGAKHPQVLGQPGRVAWSEIWESQLGPLLQGVVQTGEAFHARDLLFMLERYGFPEETYFDVSYDPVRDESGAVGGVYCIVTETTRKVLGERRLKILRDLAAVPEKARTVGEARALSLAVLQANPADVAQAGFRGEELELAPSARLPYGDEYRAFFDLVRSQVLASVDTVRAAEQERRRAEALAEIDRAKTAFFSNVSHEFRTPLTLMLGPVEDLLSREDGLPGEARAQLAMVQRNGQRLLKLVNTLLDFARIEAGRAQASYEPTDLAMFTADIASTFRSACEKAGLQLDIDCMPAAEPAYVDREMWEKIVLNLVSNAFKFTLAGRIAVRVAEAGAGWRLSVRDSGIGIPAADLPRVFDRFHRVEGARGRSHEGSGIGLSLVQELVRLHGGRIAAQSVPGEGTVFTVEIPKGSGHLPAERIGASRPLSPSVERAGAYVDEALGWLQAGGAPAPERSPADARRVLVVDDNADLREYARRLLAPHYRVRTATDGREALAAARAERPDLIVTDIMMPNLDGFGLIRELRADAALATLPVIALSARAGEEARLEGLKRGADDYLVKPFSARELLARVAALLQSDELRRRALDALHDSERRKDEFLATLSHELRNPLAPLRNALYALRASGVAREGEAAEACGVMERQVNHLVRLVDDLLEMSRITRGTLELRRERVEAAAVVRNAVETSEPLLRAAGHRLEVSLPGEALWVDGDPVRLAQILSNLLNNAARYTPGGGLVAVSARREGGEAVISVRDNGAGIEASALTGIFEMFSRGAGADALAQGGLGIGLTLSRRLAEMHGGTIEARSEGIGQGSEFVLRLPLAAGAGESRAEVPPGERLGNLRVLVVDDNEDAATMLGMVLKVMGAEVSVAHDGRQAIDAFAEGDPSVVLLDIGMPGMNGYEVARKLRTDFPGRRAALVALTGWGQEEDRQRAREAGFDEHIVKPPEPEALRSLLARLARPG